MNFAARRTTGLGLLVLGTMFVVGAYLLATLPDDSPIPTAVGPLLGVTVGLPLVMHLAVRRLAPQADGMLLPLAALLNGLGYVFIVRLDEAETGRRPGRPQSLWMILGAAAVATLMVVPTPASWSATATAASSASCCCSCRWCRSSGAPSTAAGSGCRSGRSTSSPASSPSWRWPCSSPAT